MPVASMMTTQADQVSGSFRRALLQCSEDRPQKILSTDALLMPPTKESSDEDCFDECSSIVGLPRRPYYQEVAKRMLLLAYGADPLLLAADMGMNELPSTKSIHLPPIPDIFTEASCLEWLTSAGDEGILRLLGLRNTVGTEVGLLPPDWTELLAAGRLSHRNIDPPHDSLTVAGRARCKHAHRGKDSFFGEVKGGTTEKNEAAERVLDRILREAAWINIHKSTGIDETVLEVRVAAGYGARWTADWSKNPVKPTNVAFRGFLEPQQVDGHENRWRH